MKRIIAFLLLGICLVPMTAAASEQTPEITAQPGQVNPYKTRSELLMDAALYTGVTTPERAAFLWAEGLKARSAAMQYIVMTDALKREYAAQLDALRSNWVTGMSSPWVQNFTVTKANIGTGRAEIGLRFELMTSHAPPEFYNATLHIVHDGEFWRIARISADDELYPYTLYKSDRRAR